MIGTSRKENRIATLSLLIACGGALLVSCNKKAQPSPTQAAPLKPDPRAVYELHEKCGKDAAEWFKREHESASMASNNVLTVQNEYTNHYNERLNRCYAVVSKVDFTSNSKGESHRLQGETLADVNENRLVGRFFSNTTNDRPLKCNVDSSTCASLDEWQALAKPYMEQ